LLECFICVKNSDIEGSIEKSSKQGIPFQEYCLRVVPKMCCVEDSFDEFLSLLASLYANV